MSLTLRIIILIKYLGVYNFRCNFAVCQTNNLMIMNKKLLFIILISVSWIQLFAQDKVPGVIVELASGMKVEYQLSSKPKVSFNGKTITIIADGVKVEYEPSELISIRPGEVSVSSEIDELQSESRTINLESGFVKFTNFTKGETVYIYNVNGSLNTTYHISSEGLLMIPISSLTSGISIIKANNQTIKITKK